MTGDQGATVFEVDRFGWTGEDRLELEGRWFGVRGWRFVRPTLDLRVDGSRVRLLALLDHKPWAALDGETWVAAFPWEGEPLAFESAELAVAPSVEVALPPPDAPGGARRPAPKRAAPAAPRRDPERDRAVAQRDEAIKDRAEALRQAATAERERDEARAALRDDGGEAVAREELERELAGAREELARGLDGELADARAALDRALRERDDALAARADTAD